MSRSFVLSLQRPQEALGVNVSTSQRVRRVGKKGWVYACAVLGCVLMGFSIISVNTSAAKTFDIRSLERQAERLAEQVSVLEAQIAVFQSYASLQDRVKGMGYVQAEGIQYLETR